MSRGIAARLVAAMLAVAALLALAMSFTEGINDRPDLWRGPPDEYGHRSAARHYVDHWLPPRLGEADTLDSYSRDYGLSYLNDPDPAYFMAGRFAALLSPLVPNHDRAFRLFNVALLAGLAVLCWRRPTGWLAFAPLLISPQIWYIFSYFNGDALALFLAVILAYEIATPESAFNRYLDDPGWRRGLAAALGVAVLAGVLALSKRNYLGFVAFLPAALALGRLGASSALLAGAAAIAAAAAWLHWVPPGAGTLSAAAAVTLIAALAAIFGPRATRRPRARALAKLTLLAGVAATLVFSRYALDVAINGTAEEKMKTEAALQERIAKPEYRSSQVFQAKDGKAAYYGLYLRARGTPLKELFGPFWSWHTRTFSTLTGSYGWLQFNSPKPYAILLVAAYIALFGVYAGSVARSKDAGTVGSFVLVAAFCALTVAVSVYHSWNNDFQAQGRYLFPALGTLGFGWSYARRSIPSRAMAACVAACFLLSVYSFVFVGLTEVQKSF